MTYFKVLSVVLGAWMLLGGLWVSIFPEGWKRLVLRLYPEIRPRWMPATGILVLLLVLWTWVEFVKAATMENFVVTLVVSLGLVKVAPLVFFYKKSREFLMALVAEPVALRVMMLSTAAIGAALLVMGIFF
jgi:hypothetical protein